MNLLGQKDGGAHRERDEERVVTVMMVVPRIRHDDAYAPPCGRWQT